MPHCVIDANVAIKIITRENSSSLEEEILKYQGIIAPDYLKIECSSILTRKVRGKFLKPTEAQEAFSFLNAEDTNITFYSAVDLLSHAFNLSVGLHLTLYDCLYLSLAVEQSVVLMTFDQAIKNAIQKDSFLNQHVVLLEENNNI